MEPASVAAGTTGRIAQSLRTCQYCKCRESSKGLRTLLVLQAALRIRALWVPLSAVHLTVATVLLRAVHLLRLLVLWWSLATSWSVPDRR